MRLKKDDTVKIIAGKDKGRTGKIIKVDPENERVYVQGANMVMKTQKKRTQQDKGGIVEIEAPIHVSNVQLVSKDKVAIGAQEEVVVLLGGPKALGGGAYSLDQGLDGKIGQDLKAFVKESEQNPEDLEAVVFAGKTFAHLEKREGDYEKLEALGLLEAGKITGGINYVDLPVLALLSLRHLGVKMKNIILLPVDVAEYGDILYREGEEKKNAFSLERR